jgi:hypothetical protein
MPPAAISRSSTYFPKICGNIAAKYRSAFPAFLLATGAVGCSDPAPSVTTVEVGAHELAACPLPDRGPEDPSPFRLTLMALGDFPASGFDVETDIGLHDAGRSLAFDPATVGVDAIARDSPTDTGDAFIGHSERRDGAHIDVLLWPEEQACAVAPATDSGYPGDNAGQALGFSQKTSVVLGAGENIDDQRAGSALTFDTELGTATPVARDRGALRVSRAFATVSEFGGGLLVAGGTNPFGSGASEDAAGTAEIFDPATGGFDNNLVELWSRRTHHAALTLPTTGETLLIGGVAPDSASNGPGQVIRQLEAISPATRSSGITDLSALALGRVDPSALVLGDGRLFVGGGYTASTDASSPDGAPVGQVEWFSPDATRHLSYAELPARAHRTFAALPGGGVLSVASCSGEPTMARTDCACLRSDGTSCDADSDPWIDAWWIDPDGTLAPVVLAPVGVLTACPTPAVPLLLAGSDGSPWLVSASDDGSPACLFRFEPWPESAPTSADPDDDDSTMRPRFLTTAVTLGPAPDTRTSPLSLGPDTFVWISALGGLYGARLGQRGPLSRDDLSLLSSLDAPYRPAHLVPDRDPRLSRATDANDPDTPAVVFDRMQTSVTLAPVAPPVTLWVTDTLYDDVAISIEIQPAADGSVPALPLVAFASSTTGDSVACAWSPLHAAIASSVTLTATRHGTRIELAAQGTDPATCDAPAGPLAVGVRAGAGTTTLSELFLARLLLE